MKLVGSRQAEHKAHSPFCLPRESDGALSYANAQCCIATRYARCYALCFITLVHQSKTFSKEVTKVATARRDLPAEAALYGPACWDLWEVLRVSACSCEPRGAQADCACQACPAKAPYNRRCCPCYYCRPASMLVSIPGQGAATQPAQVQHELQW